MSIILTYLRYHSGKTNILRKSASFGFFSRLWLLCTLHGTTYLIIIVYICEAISQNNILFKINFLNREEALCWVVLTQWPSRSVTSTPKIMSKSTYTRDIYTIVRHYPKFSFWDLLCFFKVNIFVPTQAGHKVLNFYVKAKAFSVRDKHLLRAFGSNCHHCLASLLIHKAKPGENPIKRHNSQ